MWAPPSSLSRILCLDKGHTAGKRQLLTGPQPGMSCWRGSLSSIRARGVGVRGSANSSEGPQAARKLAFSPWDLSLRTLTLSSLLLLPTVLGQLGATSFGHRQALYPSFSEGGCGVQNSLSLWEGDPTAIREAGSEIALASSPFLCTCRLARESVSQGCADLFSLLPQGRGSGRCSCKSLM